MMLPFKSLNSKLTKKFFKPLIIGALLCSAYSVTANADWYQENNVWHYTFPNGIPATSGIHQINGVGYLFDAAGNMLTGWQQTANGLMYFNPVSGAMAKGWQQIDGKWYCFNDYLGILYTNCTTPDGYTVDANGVWAGNSGSTSSGNSAQGSSANTGKTLNEIYQEHYGSGTDLYATYGFIDYSNTSIYGSSYNSGSGVVTAYNGNTFSNNNYEEAEYEEEDLSEKDIYKLLTGSYSYKTDPSKNLSDDETLEKIVEYVNILRSKKGLNEVTTDDTLMEVADLRAEELTEKYSHTRPDGSDCFSALDEAGWPDDVHVAENIAKGQTSALNVVNAWYHSSGHRANMMNNKNNYIGVGMNRSGGSKVWVQIFSE
jgi:uncharacterized protein YkwD